MINNKPIFYHNREFKKFVYYMKLKGFVLLDTMLMSFMI